jgi:crotonobetainyl-CoA:carnitine CoA-transferase CaiB-like acyl-CoA transferase
VTPPLTGIRVLELGAYTTGPLSARYLSNLGAEVVKVEPLKGESIRGFAYKIDGVSYIFHVHNLNKRGVAIDTKTECGKEVLLELVRTSDVLIENFACGRMKSWGLSYKDLSAINPGLIYCSLSGFGHDGPYRDMRAFDTVIQGMAGIMSLTGTKDYPPTKIGVSSADNIGAATGTMAITAALHHKRRTGRGQHINISMHDVQGWMSSEAWAYLDAPGGPQRDANHHATLAPQNLYEAADGMIVIEVETQTHLDGVTALLGLPACSLDTAKSREAEFDNAFSAWARGITTQDAIAACDHHGVPVGKVQSMAEIAEAPHTWSREMLVKLEHPTSGPLKLLGSPFKSSQSPGVVLRTAPDIGQHTREVLAELLGYDDATLTALEKNGVIGVGK